MPVQLVCPPGYAHCGALAELAETVRYGLEALALPDEPTIVLGAHLDPSAVPVGAIVYNTEIVGSGWVTGTAYQRLLLNHFPVWDVAPDRFGKYVPIGYMPQMTRIPKADSQDIDVLFYGSMNERRAKVLDGLRDAGLRVVDLFGVYGAERDAYIAQSKVVLNMHYYTPGVFEAVRVSYLWANRKCVVCERSPQDNYQMGYGVAYEDLVEVCAYFVKDAAAREAEAEDGFAVASGISEVDILREALK